MKCTGGIDVAQCRVCFLSLNNPHILRFFWLCVRRNSKHLRDLQLANCSQVFIKLESVCKVFSFTIQAGSTRAKTFFINLISIIV